MYLLSANATIFRFKKIAIKENRGKRALHTSLKNFSLKIVNQNNTTNTSKFRWKSQRGRIQNERIIWHVEEEEKEELAARELEAAQQEEEERELLQGQAINSMFGMFEDDDEEPIIESKPEYDENGYRILSPTNSFCFCCGEEWIEGHICDNQFRRDLIEILQTAPVKKIGYVEGVPSVRACPNCCQLLFHIEYCKHMHCKGCKKRFCMVCLKPKKDGNWQCGGSSDRCPIAPRQNDKTLPHNIVITKQKFELFERVQEPKNGNKNNDNDV